MSASVPFGEWRRSSALSAALAWGGLCWRKSKATASRRRRDESNQAEPSQRSSLAPALRMVWGTTHKRLLRALLSKVAVRPVPVARPYRGRKAEAALAVETRVCTLRGESVPTGIRHDRNRTSD